MPTLLSHLDIIEEIFQKPRSGLITDVDGTISPIAPTPQQAKVSPVCRRHLAILSRRLALVAAISGRPAAEVGQMVGISDMVYIGNHGLEKLVQGRLELPQGARDYAGEVRAAVDELGRLLRATAGISIENKGVTATIHYRLSPDPELARQEIIAAIEKSGPAGRLRIKPGKMSLNLLPPLELDKGTAVAGLIKEYNLQSGLYLGDDYTDIDAFRAIHNASEGSDFKGYAIAVTSREMPAGLVGEADFTLEGIAEVERFLGWLARKTG
ncbi:MAG: trehalose-phosphatase [Dehalococcoidales bacterium]